jgi:CRISPR-associated endoribonuclease Cas6
MINQEVKQTNRLRQVRVTVQPMDRFPVPFSDGYSVYSALLAVLEDVDDDVSAYIHDSPLGSLHNSGLQGAFGDSDRSYHKMLLPDKSYELTLGVIDPADAEIFEALLKALVLEGDGIELSHGKLEVESFESENTTHEKLLDKAGSLDDPTIEISFETATCIEDADGVTTMFPQRAAVFNSLAGKWASSAPEELEFGVSREEIEANVIEKPDDKSYQTHSVVVERFEDSDGHKRPRKMQGFSGTCSYAFKDASESVKNAVTALGLFAEYAGVGSAVARGCGQVSTEVND